MPAFCPRSAGLYSRVSTGQFRRARGRAARPEGGGGKRRLGLRVLVLELALGDLFQGHRQVVLRARLHKRRRIVVERPLTELVVVVVDLPGPLRRHDHEGIAGVDVLEQLIDAWMNHELIVAARSSSRWTIPASSATARSRSSFSITWSKRSATSSCSRATRSRSSISPALSVARSRRRRSSSGIGAVTKTVTAPGTRSATFSAPSVSSSSRGARPLAWIR